MTGNKKPPNYDAMHREAYARLSRVAAMLQTAFRPIDVIGLLVTAAMAIRLVHEDRAATAAWLREIADDVERGDETMN